MQTCQVFVALCSPRYFLSDRCGREWWIFAERVRRHQEATGRRAPALIPVLWSATDPGHAGTDEDAQPVANLIRLRHLRPRYEAYLADLAERIVASIREHHIPDLIPAPDPDGVPNAFDDPVVRDPALQVPDPRQLAGAAAQRVHLVVAAGSRSEMATVRGDLQFYGDKGREWAPYRPELGTALAEHARAVAARRLFGVEIADLDDLPGRIDTARRNNEIVVLLVDAWVTKLPGRRRVLADFDEEGEASTAMLAPASGTDRETGRHRGELRADMRAVLQNNLARGDNLVRTEIGDAESFDADLAAVLAEAQNRIFRRGRVFRRPERDVPATRPILQGP